MTVRCSFVGLSHDTEMRAVTPLGKPRWMLAMSAMPGVRMLVASPET